VINNLPGMISGGDSGVLCGKIILAIVQGLTTDNPLQSN
jgi:hypothetical protein